MRPVLVVIGGLPAIGKSTIARALAIDVAAPYLRVDRIEQAIWPGRPFPTRSVRPATRWGTGSPSSNLSWARMSSSNASTRSRSPAMRGRLQRRASDVDGLVKPTWDEVVEREYEPWHRTPVRIDTSTISVPRAVQRIAAEMAEVRTRKSATTG
jgi:hypothetical protein